MHATASETEEPEKAASHRITDACVQRGMQRGRAVGGRLLCACLLLLVACRRRHVEATGEPRPMTSASTSASTSSASASAPPAAPPAGASLCPALTKLHVDAVAKLRAAYPKDLTGKVPRELGRCFPSARGAWALVFELGNPGLTDAESLSIRPFLEPSEGFQVRWALRFRETTGGDAIVHPMAGEFGNDIAVGLINLHLGGYYEQSLEPPTTFDWDGDGRDEIVVTTSAIDTWWRSEGPHGRVWRAASDGAKGRIEHYPAAESIDVRGVRDVDADGRPDLETYVPYLGYSADYRVSGKSVPVHGPLFVARSLPDGTFALDDPASHAAARAYCPKAPVAPYVVFAANGEANEEISAKQIVCARLWGVATTTLEAEIQRCGDGDACLGRDVWRRWAKVAPPLVLR
jgi:hypothetical protein